MGEEEGGGGGRGRREEEEEMKARMELWSFGKQMSTVFPIGLRCDNSYLRV